ncbi:MAG TPA: ribonuclease J, partial [Lachnospiraceae bacterium]|nr:ribonuclease J [Lachnospiraceae bacterium]HBH71041.1 ribonuclease J [Lachnospiraceae bacterium]
VIVSAAMDAESQIVAGPEITSRGFVYLKEADVLMNEASVVTADAMDKYLRSGKKDRNKLGVVIRDSLGEFFWKKTKRRPMILPVILDV